MRIRYLFICLLLAACKKGDEKPALQQPPPEIANVSAAKAQAGDTLEITGKNLSQPNLPTEVFIAGRPTTLLSATPEKLRVKVSANTLSGSLLVFVGGLTGRGPELTIHPTASIKGFTPAFLVQGDTLLIQGENFAPRPEDNNVLLGDKKVEIVTVSDRELKVVIPPDAATGMLRWQTYGGPWYTFKEDVLVRKNHYKAGTIMEWLAQDPGFSFVYHYLASAGAASGVDTLLSYLDGTRAGMVFLPNNNFGKRMNIFKKEDVLNIRYYDFIWPLLAVTSHHVVPYEALQPATIYPSQLTGEIIGFNEGSRDYFTITETEGRKAVVTLSGGNVGWLSTHRILRELKIGRSILYEIEELPSFESQPF